MSETQKSSYLIPVIALVAMIGITLYGINLWFQIDDSIDFNILHEQIMTNQTFVDEMSCEKIILSSSVLNQLNSPRQQDVVIELRADFDQLIIDKKCNVDEVKK